MVTQADLDRLKWFHDFEFPGGLRATSSERTQAVFHRTLWSFIGDQLARVDLKGKSVIDIGCWDGYFSFLAEQLGAKAVLAVDDYSQNWGSPEAFQMAKALKRSAVELRRDVSVYELERIEQRFDVVLMLGVYYHLHAPFAAFAGMRALCAGDDSVALVEGECIRDEEESYARVSLDNAGAKFVPTLRLLREMLEACYFSVEGSVFLSEDRIGDRLALSPTDELLELAANAVKARQHGEVPRTPESSDRVFLCLRPVRNENRHHRYKPPFGLHRFDTRTF
jgi:tRNA (mo5U34)-methyltransferase